MYQMCKKFFRVAVVTGAVFIAAQSCMLAFGEAFNESMIVNLLKESVDKLLQKGITNDQVLSNFLTKADANVANNNGEDRGRSFVSRV